MDVAFQDWSAAEWDPCLLFVLAPNLEGVIHDKMPHYSPQAVRAWPRRNRWAQTRKSTPLPDTIHGALCLRTTHWCPTTALCFSGSKAQPTHFFSLFPVTQILLVLSCSVQGNLSTNFQTRAAVPPHSTVTLPHFVVHHLSPPTLPC